MKTIEERAELNFQYERYFCGYNLSDNMVKRAYRKGATEQKAIDSKMFDEFLCSLRNGNMWEGREWRFQRMWREFVENYIAVEE